MEQCREFLFEAVNLRRETEAASRLLRRYKSETEVFSQIARQEIEADNPMWRSKESEKIEALSDRFDSPWSDHRKIKTHPRSEVEALRDAMGWLATNLVRVWEIEDLVQRKFLVDHIAQMLGLSVGRWAILAAMGTDMPDPTGSFPAIALSWLADHVNQIRICQNPDCAAPYFFAKRGNQRICSDDLCRSFASREAKKKWWNKKGKPGREKNREKGRKAIVATVRR